MTLILLFIAELRHAWILTFHQIKTWERKENKSEAEIQLPSYLKHGLCHYVVRLKPVTGNKEEVSLFTTKSVTEDLIHAWVNMCAAASEPSIIHADLKLLDGELVKARGDVWTRGIEDSLDDATVKINKNNVN